MEVMEEPMSFSPLNSSLQQNSSLPVNSTVGPSPAGIPLCKDSYVSPDWINTVIPVYIYSISALGILLNLLVLLVFLLHKKACTATEIYLSNMAAADLFLVVLLPFWGIYVSNGQIWTFGEPMCKTVTLFIVLNFNCSVYFLIMVCVDRFLALAHPFSQCKLHRRKYAKLCCVAVWCSGILLNIPTFMCRQTIMLEPLAYNKTAYYNLVAYTCEWNCSLKVYLANDIVQTVVTFAVPLLIISFCTVKILLALKERPTAGVNNQTERKVTILVLTVLLTFTICWLPFRVQKIVELAVRFKLIEENCKFVKVLEVCQHVFVYLGFFNSDLNPVLYVIVGKNFRKKMWEVLSIRGWTKKSSELLGTPRTCLSQTAGQSGVNQVTNDQ